VKIEECGVPTAAELARAIPDEARLARGPVAIIECFQDIPCDPCQQACPRGAISGMAEDISHTPVLDADKCNGCGLCIAQCPGLAIFVVDLSDEAVARVRLPYEYLPVPEVGQEVTALDRLGRPLGRAAVVHAFRGPRFSPQGAADVGRHPRSAPRAGHGDTHVPRGGGVVVSREMQDHGSKGEAARTGRGEAVRPGHAVTNRPAEAETARPQQAEATRPEQGDSVRPEEDTIICRCEDLTLADIRYWLDRGCLTLDELKRMSRCGMGPCGGRTCRPLVTREVARRRGVPVEEVELPRFRPPTRPVLLGSLARLEGEGGED